MTHVRQDCVFILCRPADVRNVGGAIRAVANAGIGAIRVVTQQAFDARDLLCYSSGATDIYDLDVYSSLGDAIADCNLIIGSSRRLRDADAPPEWPAAGLARRVSGAGKTAVLFGCERTGLTRDELSHCSAVVTIPTMQNFPSMNLAHAVACLSYELARPESDTVGPQIVEDSPKLAAAARDAFYSRVLEICSELKYPHGRSSDAFVRRLRKVLHRANLNQQELSMFGGLFSELDRVSKLANIPSDSD